MSSTFRRLLSSPWFYVVTIVVVAAATIGVMILGRNIVERRAEGERAVFAIEELSEETVDPAVWGRNFPRQYDSYLRTTDTVQTKYGGSEAFSRLEADPRLLELFAGYAFALEYREERGHANSLVDQEVSARVKKKEQPGACLHCHASITLTYYEEGVKAGADAADDEPLTDPVRQAAVRKGFETVNPMLYQDARKLVEHPVACIDCHDPQTLDLRITRPGFLDGIARLAASEEDLPHLPSIERWREGDREQPYDPNADASRQEMRAFVCGQCHVEYYFKGDEKLLTYPWHNGVNAEDAEAYYDEVGWADWEHEISGAPVLKAQHPEFEVWNTGIHARSGVACADCHMPYERDGALKVSNHHVRSPLLDTRAACGTCHPYDSDELVARAEGIQDRTKQLLDTAEQATVELIRAIAAAADDGADDTQLAAARGFQRKAQWRTDFVNAENSLGFHSPQEQARNLGLAIEYARQGMVEIARVQAEL
jgi:nitrite reductase (cytochrome c-552)